MHISDIQSPWAIDSSALNALLNEPITMLEQKVYEQLVAQSAMDVQPSGESTRKIAVVGMNGPITKYGTSYTPGTKHYATFLENIEASKDYAGTVLIVDSPGGSATAMLHMEEAMRNLSKPVVVLVDGMAASAAMGIASAADRIIALPTSQLGSIGTYYTFINMKSLFEKMGAKIVEVYATRSTDKNKEVREAEKDNLAPLQALADEYNNRFISMVATNRGIDAEKSPVFTGNMYWAADAVSNGLADRIGTLNDALQAVFEISQQTQQKSPISNSNTEIPMKFKAMWTALIALFAFTAVKAEETPLTDEHLEKINATIETLNADLKKANDNVTALTKQVQDLTTENTELKQRSQPATTNVKGADTPPAGTTTNEEVWSSEFSGKAGKLGAKLL